MPILENGPRRARLGYCTNVHPGETLEAVEANLDRFAAKVRERLTPAPLRMGVGLWLAAPLARELGQDEGRARALRRFLDERGLFCASLNAFPVGGFHAERVKRDVYRPRWDEEARLDYTLDAARALAALLPDEEDWGTLSTVPLGWAGDYDGRLGEQRILDSIDRLVTGVRALRRLVEKKGKRIRILLEPEPGCRIERTSEAVRFLHLLAERCSPADVALLVRHVGVNLDCCHQAVIGEDPAAALEAMRRASVPVGKVHLSSALTGTVESLAGFAEPRWLHQVVACDESEDGPDRADDLADVVGDAAWKGRAVRCHYHVPIHRQTLEPGGHETTHVELAAALDEVLRWPEVPDLEIETYTWSALSPEARRVAAGGEDEALIASIAGEMQWVIDRMLSQGWELAEPAVGASTERGGVFQ